MRPTWGLWYWQGYLLLISLAFLPAEIYAFFTNSANTLSDFSWYELGVTGSVNHHTITWWLSVSAWLIFVAVITGHIWFRTPG